MARKDPEELFWQSGVGLQKFDEERTRQRPMLANRRSWEPRIDLVEENDRFVLKAELAGVKGDEIELTYLPDRHAILLRGVRPEDGELSGHKIGVYQLEILYGEFEREVNLPERAIDPSGIRAQYRNGFLLVMIPTRERANSAKSVRKQIQ